MSRPAFACILALGLVTLPAPSQALNPPTYYSQFGTPGGGNGQLSGPSDVAAQVDSDLHVYVADRFNGRVQKFDRLGTYVAQWPVPDPISIEAHPNKDLYVVEESWDRVTRYFHTGAQVATWSSTGNGPGAFVLPLGVGIGADGAVHITDDGNDRVQRFDPTLSYQTFFGGPGASGGQLDLSSRAGLGVDSNGNVYVANVNNDRIEKYSAAGAFVEAWGTTGIGDGEFSAPVDVTVDQDGFVYVVDSGNDRLQIFDTDGNFLTKWGTSGAGNGQFSSPLGVDVTTYLGSKYVYVADPGNSRIQQFLASYASPEYNLDLAKAITISPDGGLATTIEVQGELGPMIGVEVEIRFSLEADALIAWDVFQERPVTAVTDGSGFADFFIKGAGCVPPGSVPGGIAEIWVEGVKLGDAWVSSPDAVDSMYQPPVDRGGPICEGGRTEVDLSDALFHTDPILFALESPCTKMTPPFADPVGLADAVIIFSYVQNGLGTACR